MRLNIRHEFVEYQTFLLLEKGLSANTIESYMRDIEIMISYFEGEGVDIDNILEKDITNFVNFMFDSGKERSTQARTVSGMKSFFNYLLLYDKIEALKKKSCNALAKWYPSKKKKRLICNSPSITLQKTRFFSRISLKSDSLHPLRMPVS